MASFETIMKKFLEQYESQTEEAFTKEFMTLKSLSQKYKENNRYPADAGQLTVNRRKNRFKDILPFEYTRVELHPVEGVEGSDYINANYILGADGEIDYIAAQGPLPHTVDDFWRMLWYHNIEVVVMACREVEVGKQKCHRYWPEVRKSMEIGAITVTTTYEENISNDFVVRDFTAECQGEKQCIRQYHYNAWPDHGKPESPDPIIRMIEMIANHRKQKDVPVVVHCSAGCGRTGTLISIDIAKKMLLSREVPTDFSVYKIVEKMRQQRPAMVQAKDQYIFVYMAIAELARRSIGFNPTLPPKPAPKQAAPTGKSYMNIDTQDPSVNSRSPTPPSTNSSSPPGTMPTSSQDTSDTHLYQNVTAHPPPPSHHRKATPTGAEASEDSKSAEVVKEKPSLPGGRPTVAKRPLPKNRGGSSNASTSSVASGSPPSHVDRKTEEDEEKPVPSGGAGGGPMPKPRPRGGKKGENGSAPALSPPNHGPPPPMPKVSPPSIVARSTSTPDGRPTPPGGLGGQRSLPNVAAGPRPLRSKSPDMSHRPLPTTPERRAISPSPSPSPRPSSSSSASPAKSLSPEKQKPLPPAVPYKLPPTAMPPPPGVVANADATYSLVGPGMDVGPGIMVLDDKGNKAPLEAPTTGPKITNKGSPKPSIQSTLMDILGEDVINSVDSKSSSSSNLPRPRPSVPPLPSKADPNELTDSLDEPPPEIPQRTDARLELVDFKPDSGASPTYDIPGVITTTVTSIDADEDDDKELKSGGYEQPTPYKSGGYEQPTPFSKNVSGGLTPSTGSKPALPSTLPPSLSPTVHTSSSSTSKGSRGMLSIFKKKSKTDPKKDEKLKKEFSGTSVTLPSNNRQSLSASNVVEDKDKYKFPGSLGYGIRLERPSGPRDEPEHWKTVSHHPPAIHVS